MASFDIDLKDDPPSVAATLRVPVALVAKRTPDEVHQWAAVQLIEMSNLLGLNGMRTVKVVTREPSGDDDPAWARFYDVYAIREHLVMKLPAKWLAENPDEPSN